MPIPARPADLAYRRYPESAWRARIQADEERWHRATSTPNTGKSIRMAITSRAKEGRVLYVEARP